MRTEVSARHPRIYVRHDDAALGLGLNVSELRRRAGSPAYARWRRPVSSSGPAGIAERAARYLEDRSPADLDEVRRFLATRTFSYAADDVSGFLAGAEMAMAFDWIYDGLSDAQRRQAMSNIVTTADSSADFLLHGEPDINHNYTYMALRTVAMCGLALRGEAEPFDARAREYLAMAALWLEGPGRVLDTWKVRQGAWSEGSHYTFHETLRTLIMTLHAYRTATGTDYFPRIRSEYGDFVARSGRFLIASVRPDLTFERIGDITASRVFAAITVPLTVEMISCGLDDVAEAARLRSFARELEDSYGDKALAPTCATQPTTPCPASKPRPTGEHLGPGQVEMRQVKRPGCSSSHSQTEPPAAPTISLLACKRRSSTCARSRVEESSWPRRLSKSRSRLRW